MKSIAYLDIETTGLSSTYHDLTVIGLHIENDNDEVMQFVGEEISSSKLLKIIKKVDTVYTFNGSRFDLPFIKGKLKLDITSHCKHEDLMYACWQRNLKGGLKVVEKTLGIRRKIEDVDGYAAVQLWNDYQSQGCSASLKKLLDYNKEDVLNLKVLRRKLKA
ncbi:MAG: ribonuclease H-like domain-containing protein [Nitrospirae bacterium]|nr:ribonuclease H-like domain-containing protein [Nitrospirota bacterium]